MFVSQRMELGKSSYLTSKRIRFTTDAVVMLVMLEEGGQCECKLWSAKKNEQFNTHIVQWMEVCVKHVGRE